MRGRATVALRYPSERQSRCRKGAATRDRATSAPVSLDTDDMGPAQRYRHRITVDPIHYRALRRTTVSSTPPAPTSVAYSKSMYWDIIPPR
jgi:hypothetical protein